MDIAFFTACRSEWTLIQPLLRAAARLEDLRPRLLVSGAHLSPRHGHGIDVIRAAGFTPDACIPALAADAPDGALDVARAAGRITLGLADALHRQPPRWLVLAGDRYEALAAATAATLLRIPIAHVGGGETDLATNCDGNFRNALTKLAQLHCVSHSIAAQRVAALGEEPWRIRTVGLPSLDPLVHAARRAPHRPPDLPPLDFVLVSFLPVTLAPQRALDHLHALIAALSRLDELHKLVVLSNADVDGDRLDAHLRRWADARRDVTLHAALPPDLYAAALRHARCYIGNSSSGVIETPVFGTPAVLVGQRQLGRPRAVNAIEMPDPAPDSLLAAIRDQIRHGPYHGVTSPYGDGDAAPRVLAAVRELDGRPDLLTKRLVVSEPVA